MDIFFFFFFFFFAQKSKHNEAVLTSTHNLCFGANRRKIGKPLQTHFFYIKVGLKGIFIARTCLLDLLTRHRCFCDSPLSLRSPPCRIENLDPPKVFGVRFESYEHGVVRLSINFFGLQEVRFISFKNSDIPFWSLGILDLMTESEQYSRMYKLQILT